MTSTQPYKRMVLYQIEMTIQPYMGDEVSKYCSTGLGRFGNCAFCKSPHAILSAQCRMGEIPFFFAALESQVEFLHSYIFEDDYVEETIS